MIFILVILLIFICIPLSFASEDNSLNDTVYTQSTDDDILSAQEIYFNASAEVDGDGSKENPYKTLNIQRIGYGNTLYFANGVYELQRTTTINKATFIGQDADKTVINQNGREIYVSGSLTLQNLTLSKSSITNNAAVVRATNVIFDGGSAKVSDKYDASFGGAISNFVSEDYHSYAATPELYIDNCTFINNNAVYGGAIYLEYGSVQINNSVFKNNYAQNFGGALCLDVGSTATVENSIFDGDISKTGEAGGIYVTKSKLTMDNCTFNNCLGTLGAGICDLNSTLILSAIKAYNNVAAYDGGVIYKMYGSISISDSEFNKNGAKNGGAVYVDNASKFILKDSKFNDNYVSLNGGAIYSLSNSGREFSNNTYSNNTAALYNDELITNEYNMRIGSGNYQMFKYDKLYNGTIPERYNLVDDGYVSPLADQQTSGNCWAFASIAALESCILKATNNTYDLSEENMKNLIEWYSDYGWKMQTNEGGFDEMAIAYLTSWLGPVLESEDIFDDYSLISPVINSFMHVQNVLFLGRENYTDNDAIKQAILNYGAVVTGMYYDNYYLATNGAYYYRASTYANHAVTIVGWDDNYSKDNFLTTPPGDGAWIVKNSWGESWGDNGYFYMSYYDGVGAQAGTPNYLYTYILNDSIKLDKNYQYDISGITDYFITGKDVIWYQNVFNATDNELLTAFSTYFNTTTDWQAYIYVNDDLKLTKNGSSVAGYFTFYLNQFIPLKVNDTFRIALKINASKYASFPVSENASFLKTLYKPGVSFFSYDGETWNDLYEYKFTGYDHTYTSQVACIKAFTTFTTLNTTVKVDNYNVSIKTPSNIIAQVLDSYGNNVSEGVVCFVIDGNTYYANVSNGIANLSISFDKLGEFEANVFYSSDSLLNPSNTTTLINVSKADVNLSVCLNDALTFDDVIANITLNALNGDNLSSAVFLLINNRTYEVNVVDGNASFTVPDYLPAGEYDAAVIFNNSDKYYDAIFYANFTVFNRTVEMNMSLDVFDVKNILVNVTLNDTVSSTVTLHMNNETYVINVTDGFGQLAVENLAYDNYTALAEFEEEGYFRSNASGEIELRLINTYINSSDVVMYYHDGTRFAAGLFDENNNALSNQSVIFSINNVNYTRTTDENGLASIAINLVSNNYTVGIIFNGTDIYRGFSHNWNLTVLSTLSGKDVTKYYRNNTQYYVALYDSEGNAMANQNVSMNINGVFYNRTTNESGVARLNINLNPGTYILTALNPVTGEQMSNTIVVLSRIVENHDLVKHFRNDSQYYLKILDNQGNPLEQRTVKFNINGVFYYRESDENGLVRLNINLGPGTYILTAMYDGYAVSNNITVLPTIQSDDLEMSYKDGSTFNATLLDSVGQPAVNKSVIFNINGVFYNRTSDAQGIAHLNINLMSGEYIITSTYEGLSVSNRITIH